MTRSTNECICKGKKKDWYVGMNDGEDKKTHNLEYLYGFHPDRTHVHTYYSASPTRLGRSTSSGDQAKPPYNPPRLAVHAGVHELPAN